MNHFRTLILRPDSFRWRFLGCSSVFIAIAIWKAPSLFTDPRFWAEEGTIFYAYCLQGSFFKCLSKAHLESWHGLLNFIVYLSTLVPVRYAPAVTTFFSLLMNLALVVQIVWFSRAYKLPFYVAALLAAAWALLPQTFEVWLTSLNLSWVAGTSVVLLCAMPSDSLESRRGKVWAWAALCGLSGPGGTLALLVCGGARAAVGRTRVEVGLGAIALVSVCVQLLVLYRAGITAARTRPTDPVLLLAPMVLNSVLAPPFSIDFASALGIAVAKSQSLRAPATFGTLACGSALAAFAVQSAWKATRSRLVWLLLLAWFALSILQTYLAPRPENLLSGFAGGRYFLAGSTCLCLSLAWGARSPDWAQSIGCVLLLATICTVGAIQCKAPFFQSIFLQGPSWRAQIDACPIGQPCTVDIWPPGWKAVIVR